MEVLSTKQFEGKPNYSIEWGYATWTQDEDEEDKERFIRNRYNKVDGGFNIRGSAEVPWEDFKLMISESIINKHFDKHELANILTCIAQTIPHL